MKLNERLKSVASFVPQGAKIADIGTDHAYLPVYLIEQGRVSSAVAGDVHEGPDQAAQLTVRQSGLGAKISVRLGDGLAVLAAGEVDTVVIAGMGGQTMIEILQSHPAVERTLRVLVLQPQGAAGPLRLWLVSHGWVLDDEALVLDEGRLYEVIRAIRKTEDDSFNILEISEQTALLYEVGPILVAKKVPLLARHVKQKIADLERILPLLSQSTSKETTEKGAVWQRQLASLKELLACL